MRQICRFNDKKDYVECSPNLSVNLSKAMEEHVIPASGTQLEYNDIERSSDVQGRVRDNFDAIEMQRAIMAKGKSDAAAERAAAAAAVNPELVEGAQA